MKNLLLLSVSLALLTSCASADKLLERGDYDSAMNLAIKKMSGKKKKDVYVTALEQGFEKLTRKDMARIESLQLSGTPENWEEITRIAKYIQLRQDRIEPFLPLVSETGYQAKFSFVRTDKIINEARATAVTLYEKRLIEMVTHARAGNKDAARQAYNLIEHIQSLSTNYYKHELRDEMWDRGLTKIHIRIENQSHAIIPAGFEEELLSANFENRNNSWNRFYTEIDEGMHIDFEVVLKILDIATTREEFAERESPHTKDVVDGWEYVLDERGNVAKDSLGNDIKRDKIVRVHATVVETLQSKKALIRARMDILKAQNNSKVFSQPVDVENVFTHTARNFYGDERALEPNLRQRIPPVSFPSDAAMIWDAFQALKPRFFDEVRKANFSTRI